MEYAMFLRGVNVGGIKVAMADLRDCLTGLGFAEVKTYIQSGNVTFTADREPVRAEIEKALSQRFSYQAHVLIFDATQLAGIVADYPFESVETQHRYVVFCDYAELAAQIVAEAQSSSDEEIRAGEQWVYWSCAKGKTLDTPVAKLLARKSLKALVTTRNLNTIEKMLN